MSKDLSAAVDALVTARTILHELESVVGYSKSDRQAMAQIDRILEKHKRLCPKCGSNETDQLGPVDVTGIETYYKRCDRCGHAWDFE